VQIGSPHEDGGTKYAIACQKEGPGAILPKRANPTDAGADLFCWFDSWIESCPYRVVALEGTAQLPRTKIVLPPGAQTMVNTGIAMKIPVGFAGFVDVRSSQRNKGITSWGTGIIDSDYRGSIKVILANNGWEDYTIEDGDRIAQIVIQKIEVPEFVDIWNDTARGTGGFGSTGR